MKINILNVFKFLGVYILWVVACFGVFGHPPLWIVYGGSILLGITTGIIWPMITIIRPN